jgi:putative ABC transport system substrate-binding protein
MQFDWLGRREFITLLGGAAAWPLAARAQPTGRMRRIGVLMTVSEGETESQSRIHAFQQELAKLGWTVGRNAQIDYRWDIYDVERAQRASAELLALTPDLIVATGTSAVLGAKAATRTVPIVFISQALRIPAATPPGFPTWSRVSGQSGWSC